MARPSIRRSHAARGTDIADASGGGVIKTQDVDTQALLPIS